MEDLKQNAIEFLFTAAFLEHGMVTDNLLESSISAGVMQFQAQYQDFALSSIVIIVRHRTNGGAGGPAYVHGLCPQRFCDARANRGNRGRSPEARV